MMLTKEKKTTDSLQVKSAGKTRTEEFTPWLAARRGWDERYGDLVTRARNWRFAFLLAAVWGILATSGWLVQANRPAAAPYIVPVTSDGRVVAGAQAMPVSVSNPQVIRSETMDWMERARSIISDPNAEKHNIDEVYAHVGSNTQAQAYLNEYYRGDDPFERGQKETVQAEIHSFQPLSPNSYELTWSETTRDQRGAVTAKQEWKGVVTIQMNPPHDDETARRNPLGFYVTSVSWSKIL